MRYLVAAAVLIALPALQSLAADTDTGCTRIGGLESCPLAKQIEALKPQNQGDCVVIGDMKPICAGMVMRRSQVKKLHDSLNKLQDAAKQELPAARGSRQ